MPGTLTLTNATLSDNVAQGGSGGGLAVDGGDGGSAFGGAVFNPNGQVTLTHCTVAFNTVVAGIAGVGATTTGAVGAADGGALYTLAFGHAIRTGARSTANAVLRNSILARSHDGTGAAVADLVNDQRQDALASTADVSLNNLVMAQLSLNGSTTTGVPVSTAPPLLGALADNGGLTPTHAIGP